MGRHSSDDGDDEARADDVTRVTQATLTALNPTASSPAEPGVAGADAPDVPATPAAPDAAKGSRAGRNLPAAIGVGLGLGAVIIASLLLYRPSFVFIIVIAVLIGVYELVSAVPARPPVVPLLAGAIAMEVVAWFRGSGGLVVGLLITVGGVMVWRLGDGAAGYRRDVSASVLITLYVPLLAGFAVLLAHPSDGAGRVLAFIGTVVCSDTGGYATGVMLGKHPMAPRISKAKTWEGFAGSLLACSIAGALLVQFTFHHEWWKGVAFGLAIAVTATLGDLGESMIKRDIGIKDMGNLLPGHGGIMDRLDSLLPCAAVAYLLLSWISPS